MEIDKLEAEFARDPEKAFNQLKGIINDAKTEISTNIFGKNTILDEITSI